MEILGRNIPQLQGAISSGFDNVSAGIAETVKAAGVSAIEDTFQIFSTANMGISADADLLGAVANVAEYPDPIAALATQSNTSSEAASSSLPLLQTMQNPKFAPEAELSAFTEEKVNETFKNLAKERPDQLGDILGDFRAKIDVSPPYVSAADDNLLIMPNKAERETQLVKDPLEKLKPAVNYPHDITDYPDKLGDLIGDFRAEIDARLPYVSAADDNLLIMPNKAESETNLPYVPAADDNLLTMPNKAESESAQSRSILKNDSLEDPLSMFELKKEAQLKHKMEALDPEAAAKREAEQWRKLKESMGQVDQLSYVTAADSTAIDSTTATKDAQGSGFSQVAGASAVAVGSETPSAPASLEVRGIIIVGGKTDGTYFQTIDDSMNDLRNDPQPETVELLQNQVTAVQDMASVSMNAVQLSRQYSDLRISIRG